jgi:hypothetical protein
MNIQHIIGIFLLLLLLVGGVVSVKRQRQEGYPPVIDVNTDDESSPSPARPAGESKNVGRQIENIDGSGGSSAPMTDQAPTGFPILDYGIGGTSDDLSSLVRSSHGRLAQSFKSV